MGNLGGMGGLAYLLGLFALLWFLMIRPQKKQMQARNQMLQSLQTGVKVATIGGICGKIKAITDERVFLEIADGLTIELLRNAVSTVLDDSEAVAEDDDEYEYEEE